MKQSLNQLPLFSQFDRLENPSLFGMGDGTPGSLWYQVAELTVVGWLAEMGETVSVAEAINRMIPASVTGSGDNAVRTPGLCEQLIELLAASMT